MHLTPLASPDARSGSPGLEALHGHSWNLFLPGEVQSHLLVPPRPILAPCREVAGGRGAPVSSGFTAKGAQTDEAEPPGWPSRLALSVSAEGSPTSRSRL